MKLVERLRAAEPPASAGPLSWGDLVTPLSRASRRRWAVVAVVLCAALGIQAVAWAVADDRGVGPLNLLALVAYIVAAGALVRGTRRVATLNATGLDERELASSGDAFRTAFVLLLACVLLVLLALGVLAGRADTEIAPDGLVVAGLWIVLWAQLLPTAVLAWREPDALELDEDRQPLPEPLRDTLLAGSLALGCALDVLLDPQPGLFVFGATAATLGLLSLRVPGEPLLSWRAVLGCLFLLWLVGPTLLFSGCGAG